MPPSSSHQLVEIARADEDGLGSISKLCRGEIDAAQVYTTTELATLRDMCHGEDPVTISLCASDSSSGSKVDLGYAQVMFGLQATLTADGAEGVVGRFTDALYEGWAMAVHDPMLAGACIAQMECGQGVAESDYFGALGRDPVVHAGMLVFWRG